MQAESSHGLWSACWELKTASGVIHSEPENPEKLEQQGQDEIDVPGQAVMQEGVNLSSSSSLSYSGSQQIGGGPATLGRAVCFTECTKAVLISSGNTLTDTPGNNIQPDTWAACVPVNLTHKITHHTSRNTSSNNSPMTLGLGQGTFLTSLSTHLIFAKT